MSDPDSPYSTFGTKRRKLDHDVPSHSHQTTPMSLQPDVMAQAEASSRDDSGEAHDLCMMQIAETDPQPGVTMSSGADIMEKQCQDVNPEASNCDLPEASNSQHDSDVAVDLPNVLNQTYVSGNQPSAGRDMYNIEGDAHIHIHEASPALIDELMNIQDSQTPKKCAGKLEMKCSDSLPGILLYTW
ncbi:uncharacterized protein [Amphiura filiformis]|uniref:uncharacterized protein n=1 Tax=Amphiura filiformis TaxID=82378 RepID=UPI003B22845D